MRARPAIFALLAVAASPALAQQSPVGTEAFKSVLGKWEVSNADRDRVCVITFRSDAAGTLFRLDLDKGCPMQMPELKDVVAWTIGGLDIVRLVDAKGKPVMEFTEVESGTYEAQRPGEGVFFMESAAVAAGRGGEIGRPDGRRLGRGARLGQDRVHRHVDQHDPDQHGGRTRQLSR